MRITGGTLRGRLVKVPEGIIRPAMDRMRESVFARLGDLSGLSFLDLFSGSGVIALEAASRGAAYIEAVEMDSLKRKTLLENVQISPTRINCRFMAAEHYIKRAKRPFDLVFCDPPFPYKFKWQMIEALSVSKLMIPGSKLLLHRPREDYPPEIPVNLIREDSKEYGRSVVDFFVQTDQIE
jgi:16S rRNA (guanine(966)-N(2))-methyltransferase RsmD